MDKRLIFLNALRQLKHGEILVVDSEKEDCVSLLGCSFVGMVYEMLREHECLEELPATLDTTFKYYTLSPKGIEVLNSGIEWYRSISLWQLIKLHF